MEKISNKVFGGERPLFEIHNVELDHVRITFGESGVKECSNIVCRNCYFEGKYPLWHVKGRTYATAISLQARARRYGTLTICTWRTA